MASNKTNKKREAQERWLLHCADINRVTSIVPQGSEVEKIERIKRAKSDYAFFVSSYFPHLATKKCGKFQIDAANYILNNPQARGVFEWARGHAKSSHVSLMIPMWLMIQNNRNPLVMLLVSKSKEAAKMLLGDLQAELESNDLFIRDFGEQRGNGSWEDGRFITSAGDMFVALGRGQSPRGIKKRGIRVNYICIDDIDDDEMCRNPRRVKEAVDWCLSALYGTMDMGRGRFVLVGNGIGRKSVLKSIAEKSHFYHTVVNVLDKKGKPTWKENYSMNEVNAIRKDIGERLFQKEYMNNPVNEGTIFEKKYITYGKMLPLREYRALVCYTDPSFKSGTKNDYKATLLIGITKNGAYHVIKAFCDQTKVSDMVQWHYDIKAYVGDVPLSYYMESGFIQDTLLDEFKKVGDKAGIQIPILPDKRDKPNKFGRIEAMQALFNRLEVVFNIDEKASMGMEVLEEQLLLFEKGSNIHDDGPDALEGGIWILNNKVRVSTNRYVVATKADRRY